MSASVRIVMKFDGIKGRSKLDSANSWMPLRQISLAGSWPNLTAVGKTGARKSGTLNMGLISIVRDVDVSTHGIFTAFTQKKFSDPAQIQVLSGDGGNQVLMSCTIEKAMIGQWDRILVEQGAGEEAFVLYGDKLELKGMAYAADEKTIVASSPVSFDYQKLKAL